MTRVAAIDIGTNSVRLLVVEKAGKSLKMLKSGLCTTRLGEGIGNGMLLSGAMERTVEAISRFYQIALGLGAERVFTAATSAVRDAVNRDEFLALVRQRTGLMVRVLSGKEEAALIYRGVLTGLAVTPFLTAVVDVGGGSTELIWMQGGNLRFASVNVGAVRAAEADLTGDEIFSCLKPVIEKVRRCQVEALVGTGGTITTLAAVDQGLVYYDPERVHGYCLTSVKVAGILDTLKKIDIEERKRVPGLQPERADIIVAGAAIVKAVMNGLERDGIIVSERDILFGLVQEEVEIK